MLLSTGLELQCNRNGMIYWNECFCCVMLQCNEYVGYLAQPILCCIKLADCQPNVAALYLADFLILFF